MPGGHLGHQQRCGLLAGDPPRRAGHGVDSQQAGRTDDPVGGRQLAGHPQRSGQHLAGAWVLLVMLGASRPVLRPARPYSDRRGAERTHDPALQRPGALRPLADRELLHRAGDHRPLYALRPPPLRSAMPAATPATSAPCTRPTPAFMLWGKMAHNYLAFAFMLGDRAYVRAFGSGTICRTSMTSSGSRWAAACSRRASIRRPRSSTPAKR